MEALVIIACCTAALSIFAPVILFCLERSFVKYSPYPYCFTLLSSALWIISAVRRSLTPVYALNGVAAVANAVYMALFLCFSARADHRRRYLVCFFVGACVVFVTIALVEVAGKHDLYDGLCSLVSVLVALAPFINMLSVPQGRWREAMPPPLVPALALLNAMLWTGHNTAGVPLQDVDLHLVIPSAAAALCALVLSAMHLVLWIQGPPPPRTGIRQPLISQNGREGEQGAGLGGELRLGVDSSAGDGNITIVAANTEEANHVPPPPPPTGLSKPPISQNEREEDQGAGHGGELRLDVDSSADNGNITIVASSEDANHVPPPPPPTGLSKPPISQNEREKDQGAGHGGELRLDVDSLTDNGNITTVASTEGANHVPPPPLDSETIKPAEEKERASHVVVDHTPAVTSTKDKDDAEPAQPHGDGAAA